MNTRNRQAVGQPRAAWKKVQRAMALGVFAALPLLGAPSVSQASPPAHAPAWGYRNQKDDHWDRRNDYKDPRNGRWDDRKDRRDDCRDDQRNGRWDQRDGRWNRNDGRNDGRCDNRGNYGNPGYGYPNYGNPGYGYPGYGNPSYDNHGYGYPGYGNGYPGYGNGYPGYGNGYPGYGNPGYGYGQQSFTGVVTDVHSAESFDIRIGGDTYNVYLTGRAPRYLNAGDVVRVYGERANKNDIRASSLTILNNR